MNAIIREILNDFNLDDYRPIVPRDVDLGSPEPPRRGNLATVVTGVRRCGKSYRLFQEMDSLHASGIPWERMLYFNFEDNRIMPVTPATGDELLEAFYGLHPDALEEGAYLFLDELQEMSDWGLWLRRIIDTRKVTVYVTGSSSKMLSSEVATQFRGRSWECELFPLSFAEFVRFHGLANPSLPASFTTAERLRVQGVMGDYLVRGGFPAVQGLPPQRAALTLQGYAERVVARDVVERHDLGNLRLASLFARRALASNGRELSLRKAENEFRSRGISTSRGTLGDMLSYFEDAFLVFCVPEFSRALSEAGGAASKVYAVDPGLACANAPASVRDDGQRLEDAVYLELRRRCAGSRDGAVSTLRTRGHGYEVDFIVGDALFGAASQLYQVCQGFGGDSERAAKTRERELRALFEAMAERDVAESVLVMGDGAEFEESRDGRVVRALPAWRWLLGE